MAKFKKGDKVKCIKINSNAYFTNPTIGKIYIVSDKISSNMSNGGDWFIDNKDMNLLEQDFELLKGGKKIKLKKVNFILQYELDEDPIEEFETLVQVRKRIKELLEDETLKRDSLKVYEIKSVKEVKLSTQIIIK